jgi:ADP-ribose 1''-phosphate phosphatase
MSNIVYVNDDLFNAPKGSILAHACNCQGVWGSGVAKQFAERFPESYEDYKIVCKVLKKETIPGLACVLKYENGHIVIALFTSENYGEKVDAPDVIL